MNKPIYAVKTGRNPGIYESWSECHEQVDKFPNAVYKKCDTYSEASAYLGQSTVNNVSIPRTLIAFIGGSRYNDTLGFGIIYKDPNTQEWNSFSATFSSKPCKNVAKWAPFFLGCYFAIKTAVSDYSYQQVIICTHELNLEHWCKEGYGSHTHMARKFKEFITDYSPKINIVFSPGAHYSEELTYMAYKIAEKVVENNDNPIENPLL